MVEASIYSPLELSLRDLVVLDVILPLFFFTFLWYCVGFLLLAYNVRKYGFTSVVDSVLTRLTTLYSHSYVLGLTFLLLLWVASIQHKINVMSEDITLILDFLEKKFS